jgi:hypothetical protein
MPNSSNENPHIEQRILCHQHPLLREPNPPQRRIRGQGNWRHKLFLDRAAQHRIPAQRHRLQPVHRQSLMVDHHESVLVGGHSHDIPLESIAVRHKPEMVIDPKHVKTANGRNELIPNSQRVQLLPSLHLPLPIHPGPINGPDPHNGDPIPLHAHDNIPEPSSRAPAPPTQFREGLEHALVGELDVQGGELLGGLEAGGVFFGAAQGD